MRSVNQAKDPKPGFGQATSGIARHGRRSSERQYSPPYQDLRISDASRGHGVPNVEPSGEPQRATGCRASAGSTPPGQL